jgi:hypothetical protein
VFTESLPRNGFTCHTTHPKMKVLSINLILRSHRVRCVPCHHGMTRSQVADGRDDLQIWRVAANILNKQSRPADKGWSSSGGVGREANNSSQ